MKRKIIGNILVSLLIPILFSVRWFPAIYKGIFYGEYEYYDFQVNTFGELLGYIYGGVGYFFGAILGYIAIILPFQIIKESRYNKGKVNSFKFKWVIISLIVLLWILIFGTFSNIWMVPWWHNLIYIGFSFGFGLICNTVLYLGVDRYVEHLPAKEE